MRLNVALCIFPLLQKVHHKRDQRYFSNHVRTHEIKITVPIVVEQVALWGLNKD